VNLNIPENVQRHLDENVPFDRLFTAYFSLLPILLNLQSLGRVDTSQNARNLAY